MTDKIRFLEEIASNGHVALKIMQYDGWIMRFSNGYTGRANSISLIYPSTIPLEEKIFYCEKCYEKQGLPAIIKLTENDKELSDLLAKRGYQIVTPTDVMLLDNLQDGSNQLFKETCFSDKPDEWLPYYFDFENISEIKNQDTFKKMLSKVLVDTIYCSVLHEGKVAACASAAIEQGYALIQNVIVNEKLRGLGLGEKLCRALIAKAKEHGAEHAYLQVVQTNEIAASLYEKLGFKKVYTYWYMKQQRRDKMLKIKRLTINDKEIITDVFTSVFTKEPWNDDWSDTNQLDMYINDLVGQGYSLTYGLFEDDELIGISMGYIKHWYRGTEYIINEFCVKTERQGAGAGSFFIVEIEKAIKELGIKQIFLLTDSNVPAYNFYKKNGFVEEQTTRPMAKRF